MKKVVLDVGKIALSVITLPLWFIKMFVDVGHLPDPSGAVHEVIFRYSMLENVAALSLSAAAYLSMSMTDKKERLFKPKKVQASTGI